MTNQCAVISGGVKIFRRAAVPLDRAQLRVAAIHRRASEAQQLLQQPLHRGLLGRLDLQPQIRRFAIGAPDAKLLDFEPAAELDHLIEDLLHDVGIDQVALGLDNFLKLHEVLILPAEAAARCQVLVPGFSQLPSAET